ncbi:MAG: response regulator [Devosia sp.]|nr:response regulator [Devosia sp.]
MQPPLSVSMQQQAKQNVEILIVEDDEDDVFLLRRALRLTAASTLCGINIRHAKNGVDAISMISRSDSFDQLPNLVIVDLNMPLLDGVGFLHALRKTPQLSDICAIVLTTSDQTSIQNEARLAGADDVFVKPETLAELTEIATRIFSAAGWA